VRCKVEGQHHLGAARGIYEIMDQQSTMAEEVVQLVKPHAAPVKTSTLQTTSSSQPTVEHKDIPSCLRSTWNQVKKERRPLLDGGEGKKAVSFHGSVLFPSAKGRRERHRRDRHASSVKRALNSLNREQRHLSTHTRSSAKQSAANQHGGSPMPSPTKSPCHDPPTGSQNHEPSKQQTINPNTVPRTARSRSPTTHRVEVGHALPPTSQSLSTLAPTISRALHEAPTLTDRIAVEEVENLTPNSGAPPHFEKLWEGPLGSFHGLQPPSLDSGLPITGEGIKKHRIENKRKRIEKQASQHPVTY
jgi:hypothetical protein